MTRKTIEELKKQRLQAMSADERAVFDEEYAAVRLALDVGEKIRDAREAAGLRWVRVRQLWLASRRGASGQR
jgi:ribosome-binding protein aMBF1 (putative translation factor)